MSKRRPKCDRIECYHPPGAGIPAGGLCSCASNVIVCLDRLVARSMVGFVRLLLGLFLLLLSLSDSVVVCSARQLARLLTLGQD